MKLLNMLSPAANLPPVNICAIECDCGILFAWPSNISLAMCPYCGRQELWHGIDTKPASGPWSEPEMEKL